MILYAVKCNQGYIKVTEGEGCRGVSMDRATVYQETQLQECLALVEFARDSGLENVRLIQLTVNEKEIS